jgi:hypothetical protein
MKNRFDLEQNIMAAWNVVDDLKLLLDVVEGDKAQNIVIGMIELYQLKFEKLFESFEKSI